MSSLFDIQNYLTGSLLIAVFVLCSVGGVGIIRRLFELDRLKHFHDVSGNMFSVGGTLYAVLLGLVVVDAMQNFQSARLTVEKEADALSNIHILAERLPVASSKAIRQLCRDYATQVVRHEWPMMTEGRFDATARDLTFQLIREVSGYVPGNENLRAVYPLLLQQTLDLRDAQRLRISTALHGLPTIEWLVLCAGAFITVTFTYFFHLESFRIQLAMTGMVALLIALNLYLVVLFASPFSGDLHVDANPFRADMLIFEGNEHWDHLPPRE